MSLRKFCCYNLHLHKCCRMIQLFSWEIFMCLLWCFNTLFFQESPIIPAMFLLHERKFQQCHQQLFQKAIKTVPALRTAKDPIVTDEEKGIVNAVEVCLPNIVRARCWNHIIRDVTRWF